MIELCRNVKPSECVDYVINSYYYPMMQRIWTESNAKNAFDMLSKLEKIVPQMQFMITLAENYKSLASFLEDMLLEAEDAPSEDRRYVTISTVHSAKGLEWDVVFLIDVVDNDYPGVPEPLSDEPDAIKEYDEQLEEGRRLLYVAATRAKIDLYVIFPKYKTLGEYSKPQYISRFLTEDNNATENCCSVVYYDPDDGCCYS